MTGAVNPRANEALATRNGFVRGSNTGIPCVGGTCFHAVPNAQFEGGKGGIITLGLWIWDGLANWGAILGALT